MIRRVFGILLTIIFFTALYAGRFHAISASLVYSQNEAEQKLIEEILKLDSKIHALTRKINELSFQNRELKKVLAAKRLELIRLDDQLKERRKKLARWVVFSYKGGMGTFLAVLVGAENMGDFLRRLDNIVFVLEYYNNVISETRNLILYQKREESYVMEKQKEIQALEEEARRALEELQEARALKEQELIKAKNILEDTAFLEKISKNWQEALPSLDYLLKNLSSLPWTSISPDSLKVNYFTLTARAEFIDKSITEKLLSGNDKLKNVYFTFSPEGITVSEKDPDEKPLYSVTCRLELGENNRIKIQPIRLEFNGVVLPPEVIHDLTKGHDLSFIPPPLPYDLKITSISTEEGKLILYLKKY
ncbi:coiled-coil domain-containing protein [Thermosediminibacter litoriperuensis]|uniref:Peptidoglycan hydrolase CwlO-like protein n=1 Tax=Thermosediminibacter litoriperuensis TaxID=291989 RepID=A0A5S5AXG3_9FIRM|nr:hypothetical protein [Thermosediminibacter litoriperuensis]TYP56150.1 peptidoglycan hydrolase CwlO-like protein [Thermosediminibacter litoriperuensis]